MATLGNLDYEVWWTLHHAHDALKRCEDKLFSENGLSSEQYMVLLAIESLGEPTRPTDIARWTGRSTNSVTMIVDRMVRGHLLLRRRDKKDRRTVYITLSRRSRSLIEPSSQLHKELLQKLLSPLAAGDKTLLVNRLQALHAEASKYLNGRK